LNASFEEIAGADRVVIKRVVEARLPKEMG